MKIRIGWRSSYIMAVFCWLSILACNNYASKKTVTDVSQNWVSNKQLEGNKAVVLLLYQALNDTNWAMAKTLVNKDYKHYFVKDTGFASIPWSGFEKGYRMSQNAFPDWKLTPLAMIAEGDYVSVLLKGEGTHLGSFAGIPATKLKASAPIMLLHQVKDGKIIADWEVMNSSAFLDQLKKQ
jgi:predicted ester cyclase